MCMVEMSAASLDYRRYGGGGEFAFSVLAAAAQPQTPLAASPVWTGNEEKGVTGN